MVDMCFGCYTGDDFMNIYKYVSDLPVIHLSSTSLKLFIYGCAKSPLLRWRFLWLWWVGPLSLQACCDGSVCCRA